MSPNCVRNVGFFGGNVGWMSGFSQEPDIDFHNGIKGLYPKCRVCRVSGGVETSCESEFTMKKPRPAVNLLKQLGLNDVSD
jgi:hypothetical protein